MHEQREHIFFSDLKVDHNQEEEEESLVIMQMNLLLREGHKDKSPTRFSKQEIN